jgi:hypothetical protein
VKAADHLTENTQQQTLIFHLNKVDSMSSIPAFVITSNKQHIFDIFTEKKVVVINNENANPPNLSSNVKLAVYGEIQTNDITILSNLKFDNELIINKLNSTSKKITINNGTDLILSNSSLGYIISNFNNLNSNITTSNSNLIFQKNSNIFIGTNNNNLIINNHKSQLILSSNNITATNLITSNLILLNYDSLTSNPSADSVFDIKGKIKLYNDSPIYILKIHVSNNNLFLITNNNSIYSYDILLKTTNLLLSNFNSQFIFKTK